MNNKYPKYQIYESLYKRYFKRDVSELIKLGNINNSDRVLDLCGGNGRLTKELAMICDNVHYLDQEKDMIPEDLYSLGIKVFNCSVQDFVNINTNKYTKVFCQQAINYWLLDIDMNKFGNIFDKNGTFIFNTFGNKPTNEPMIKQYVIGNISYLEVSYLVANKVQHIQIREGYEPHYTTFDWIDRETMSNIFSPYFEVEVIEDKNTLIYICRRK